MKAKDNGIMAIMNNEMIEMEAKIINNEKKIMKKK